MGWHVPSRHVWSPDYSRTMAVIGINIFCWLSLKLTLWMVCTHTVVAGVRTLLVVPFNWRCMNDEEMPTQEQLKTAFHQFDLRIRHLQHQQISRYQKLWITVVEALLTGLGIGVIIFGTVIALTDGVVSAIDSVGGVLELGFAALLVVTVGLRVLWLIIESTNRLAAGDDPGESPE